MPRGKIGKLEISRLILGGNLLRVGCAGAEAAHVGHRAAVEFHSRPSTQPSPGTHRTGLPALLSLFVRARVKESDAWHEHRMTDWGTYARAIAARGGMKQAGRALLEERRLAKAHTPLTEWWSRALAA